MTHPFRAVARRATVRVLLAAFAALVLMLIDRGAGHPTVHAQVSPIVAENAKPGADDWDITGAGDSDIQGFATDISVNHGDTVHFKISATGAGANYGITIYRLGYYGGHGATLVDTIAPASVTAQPACVNDAASGLVDCGNWSESATWAVPPDAVSGIYIAKLERTDAGASLGHRSHIVFVVRDDARTADVVFQTSDTTWQAYNQYPGPTANGGSLYCGGPLSNEGSAYLRSCATRSAKVSYNRPFDTRAHDPQSFVFNAEYPMVRWLEANGYDVKYQAGVDTDRRGFDLTGAHKPKIFLSVGHDEYWSGNQRKTVENARNAGVNLAFFSGNEMYWKTRYEASIDGAGTAYRTLVSYKETIANAKIDPAIDPVTGVPIWTGTWRDPRFADVSDGGKPENGLIGQIFTVNCCSDRIKIPQSMGTMRLWANTGVSAAPVGDFYRTPQETLGYEWDEDLDNGARPAGLIHLSTTTLVVPEKLSDFGANVAQGTATHSLTMYRASSGALVFGAGTVQWSWGLDGTHDRGDTQAAHTPDQAMQQATVNLFADMDVQPATLQAGADPQRPLLAATKSTDAQAPTTSVVFPGAGAEVASGSRLTITGTATEQGGGVVAGVEVSIDNGTTWHTAQGTSVWNYDWTPGTPGAATIKVRAIDDSGNLGFPTTVNVIVVQGDCPCTSLWKPTTVPPVSDTGDATALELGVKIKSDVDGFITGIRYYKSVSNNGTHIANLWTTGGTKLATATFVNETQSGWQEVLFNSPVPITAGTTYIASYHTNVGHYAATNDYFTNASVDSPPLHAPTSLLAAGNGVFAVGESTFPTQTFRDTNYWVDIVFSTTSSDTTPPEISNLHDTTIDSSKVTVSWTTDEPATSKVEYSTDFTFPQAQTLSLSDSAFVTSRTLLIAGLRPNTTYYYRVTSVDAAGNSVTSPAPSFTVPGPTLRDTAQSDFLAGSGAGTYAAETHDGELILAPTVGTEFSGTTMPAGWTEYAWDPSGYAAIGGGNLIVDGVRVAMCVTDVNGDCQSEGFDTTPSAIYAPGRTLEFVATFTGDGFQHAGFGKTLGSSFEPWAIFSTMSGGALNARSNTGSAAIDTFLGSGLVGAPHRFRIDWLDNRIDYSVDGSLVASHAITVAGPMRPIAASDFNVFGGNVTVNWVRMSPYQAAGTFQSRIFDAEAPVDWHSIQWSANTAAGTGVAISIRTGNTADPTDGSWSDWLPVASAGPLTVNSRYIQYQAVLSSSSVAATPELEDVIISTGHAPVANPDSAIVPENGSHLFQASGPGSLVANDTDADPSDVLRVVGVTQPANGFALLNADGSVLYTPNATYNGPDSFTYTVSDGLLTASATVSIDVRFGNIPPVAVNDFYSINEDTVLSVPAAIGLLANDSDTEHDPLTAVLVTLPAHGQLALTADGSFTYTPNPNYAGPDGFQYKASDGAAESDPATVSIAVAQVNDPPITEADTYTAVLNSPLDVAAPGVLANDHDVEVEDTAPLHVQLVTPPSHGTLTLNADGSFSYVPNNDYLGIDTFTYRAVDHFNAAGNVATVTLTTAIKAVAGQVGSGGTVAIGSGAVDESDPLNSSVKTPQAATVTIAQGVITASQAPTGYTFLNQQVNIAITSGGAEVVADPANPIVLTFTIDHSLVPASQTYQTFEMFRNGINMPNCLGATTIQSANADPCVTGRQDMGGGDIRLTILTTHASRWNMGLSTDNVGTAPVAINDSNYAIDYGQPLAVQAPGVLANDIARSAITAHMVNGPGAGTVVLNPSGAFQFTPAANQCGPVTFTYAANDGTVDSNPATVTLVIDCVPHANDDAVTVLEDSGITTLTVLSNDNDPDPGQTLTITSVTQASNGTVGTMAGGAAVTYRPNLNYFGNDSFTYTITDGRGGSATATVNVTVTSVNDAPSFTKGANQTVLEDAGPQTVANWASAISAGPANESGQVLSFTVSSNNPALFSAPPAVSAAGTLTYTPAPDANGSATVTVVLHDDGGTANGGIDASAGQSFTIAVTPVNDAPVASNGSLSVTEDTPKAGTLAANDVDGDALTYSIVSNGAKGSAVITNASTGAFTYTPSANANGSDSFTFRVSDGAVNSNTATVTVTIAAVNDAPVANNGSLTTNEDTAATGTLSASDVDGDALTYSVVTNGTKGTATITNASTGAFSYTPNLNANGADSITFRVSDGTLTSNTATVSITIIPVNDAPVAANKSVSTNEDTAVSSTVSASDVDGDALTYSIVSNGTKGSAVITNAATGAFTYTPNANANGTDTFTFKVNDGTVNSNTATVTVTIAAVNDAPVASNGSLSVTEDTPKSGTLSASDVDGDALTYSIVTNGTKGTATITNASTGAFSYTPNLNANGADSITFRVSDGTLTSNTATVSITILAVNDAPVAANASVSTTEDTAVSGTLAATDVDGDALTYSILGNGTKGSAVITNAATGAFTYTPNANANGTDTFTFRASDASLDSNTATVTVTITAINDAPSFTKGANQTVLEDAAAQSVAGWATAISAGPADESGQALNFIVSNSNNALFSAQPAVAANGTLTFTPAANANGSATVTVQLHDNGGVAGGGVDTSAAQTFTITVTAVNDAPSFTKGADQSATQNSGAQTVAGWATAISAGPSDESAQALNFIVSNSNNALFSAQPAIAANGTLTYTSATGVNGTATVTVSLHDSGGVANGGADTSAAQSFTITIDPPPGISISNSSVLEGNSGFTPMPFTVTLSPAAASTVTVNWATAAGTASSPKDFTAASGTLTFAPGETTKTITVQIVGETTKEKDETMGVILSNAVGAQITDGSGLGTILDDDSTPRLSAQLVNTQTSNATTSTSGSSLMTASPTLSSATTTTDSGTSTTTTSPTAVTAGSVVEGDTGKKILTFAVIPTNGTDQTMTVDFATIAGASARPNIDFTVVSGTVVFPPETTDPQYITVEVMANKRHQPTHPFFVRLANPIAAVIDGLDTEADILDDDPIPSISVSDVTVGESATGAVNAVVNVTMSNDTDDVVTVNFATVAGSALDGQDYIGQSGTLTFQPGITTQAITLAINPDSSMSEALESFYVDITGATNAVIVKGRGTVTITPITAWVNSTTADFNGGTVGTGAYIAETTNGEVTLAPTAGAEFSGTALPVAWTSAMLAAGGTTAVANGSLTINGTAVLAPTTYGPGRTLEFVATFGGGPNQNVGFGLTTALVAPFAMFGTKTDGQFYARSVAPAQAFETPIAGNWFGTPHRFRIDYGTTTVTYWIDGVQKVVHTITYPTKSNSLRPTATDLTVDGSPLKVDWMRMTPYATTGVYTSKVYDAGAQVTWTTATWVADMPSAGGTVTIEVRTGNTATPDATWTAFTKILNSGDAMPAALARYAQYRVTLTTTDVTAAPAVKEMILTFKK